MSADAEIADPLVGTTVAGRYRVVRLIGQGGMGKIYEVQHVKLNRTFAMKKLAPELGRHKEAMARFQREVDVVSRLRHPNVVAVTDWETLEDGSPCFIMEHLLGGDLAERIARTGPLPWPFLGRIADEVMSALSMAHRLGIVHRDLKPQNVFVAEDGGGEAHAKLLDFGVSKIRDAEGLTTESGERLIGTPAYMAPEQADGHIGKIGPATDVWAMGVILFEMASSALPFTGDGTMATLYRICHGDPELLLDYRPDAPPAFVELVARALSRDPARRIVDMDVLRQGLREALGPLAPGAFAEPLRPADAMRATPPGGVPQPPTLLAAAGEVTPARLDRTRRRPRALWIAAAGVLAALAVFAAVALRDRDDGDPGGSERAAAPVAPIAPPAPAPAPATATAAAPEPVVVTVADPPPRTRLVLDGVTLAGPRATVPRDGRTHELRIAAPGYVERVLRLDDASTSQVVTLERAKKRSPAPKRPASGRPPPPLAP